MSTPSRTLIYIIITTLLRLLLLKPHIIHIMVHGFALLQEPN